MKTGFLSVALIGFIAGFAGNARAQCGAPSAQRHSFMLLKWNLASDLIARAPETTQAVSESLPQDQSDSSIVGLWDVIFTSGGQLYDEAFDVYHSDGTELMNDIPPPALGNVCLGVWAKTGDRSYKLKHVFWIFDNLGNLIGRGTVHEQLNLKPGGNGYTGTFTFHFADLQGKPIPSMPDVSGTLTATRITPD